MKLIIRQSNFFNQTLFQQKIIKEKKYRPLRYLIFNKLDNGNYLVFNALSSALIEITDEEKNIYDNVILSYKPELDEFIKNWFLVPIETNESELVIQIRNLLNLLDRENYINKFMILPTTDCNARCFYCFEKNQSHTNMTNEIAKDVADYICEVSKGKDVTIHWFGGEPLYNFNAINIICETLKIRGVRFNSIMTTNGYLFNDETINMALNIWNLESVQISLDGTEDIYNKIKNYIYKNDESPFKRVINNIRNLLNNKINVSVRLNVDNYNLEDIYSLSDYLVNQFGENEYFSVYAKLLFDNSSKKHEKRSLEEKNILTNKFYKLEEYLNNLGVLKNIDIPKKIKIYSCIADDKHSTIILPSGNLSYCDMMYDTEIYGNIYEKSIVKKYSEKFMLYKNESKSCSKCVLYPLCRLPIGCPHYKKPCNKNYRDGVLFNLRRQMKKTYIDWIIGGGNEIKNS